MEVHAILDVGPMGTNIPGVQTLVWLRMLSVFWQLEIADCLAVPCRLAPSALLAYTIKSLLVAYFSIFSV